MKRIVMASAIGAGLLGFASKSVFDDLKSERIASNVTTIEHRGTIAAHIGTSSKTNQILVGARSSSAADVYVSFPPGSLIHDTEIAIGPALDKSAAILSEVGIRTPVRVAEAVYIGPRHMTTTVDVAKPVTISLPLQEGTHHPALLYIIHRQGSWKSGLIPLTTGKETFEGLGYFQVAYLPAVQDPREVTSQMRPDLPVDPSRSRF